MSSPHSPRTLWVVSELYYPEQTSTGYFLTEIAEGLASDFNVRVICSKPTYSERHVNVPRSEVRHGVRIHRMYSTTFAKDSMPGRILNMLTFAMMSAVFAMLRMKRGDRMLVVTNPPIMPPLLGVIGRMKKVTMTLLVHDVYPEVLVATGHAKRGTFVYRVIERLMKTTLNLFDHLVVLGRDMAEVIRAKAGEDGPPVVIIPNWADVEEIHPVPDDRNGFSRRHDLTDKIVIQCSGNLGRSHDIEMLLSVAERLRDRSEILFLFVGYGGKAKTIERHLQAGSMSNLLFLPRQPRDQLGSMLSCATAVVIPFVDEMYGVSVPSRMYNIMAAGTPIIAVADPRSELSRVVDEEGIGWTISPGDIDGLRETILTIAREREAARCKGKRARAVAERHYTFSGVIARYRALFSSDVDPAPLVSEARQGSA